VAGVWWGRKWTSSVVAGVIPVQIVCSSSLWIKHSIFTVIYKKTPSVTAFGSNSRTLKYDSCSIISSKPTLQLLLHDKPCELVPTLQLLLHDKPCELVPTLQLLLHDKPCELVPSSLTKSLTCLLNVSLVIVCTNYCSLFKCKLFTSISCLCSKQILILSCCGG